MDDIEVKLKDPVLSTIETVNAFMYEPAKALVNKDYYQTLGLKNSVIAENECARSE